MVNPWSLFLRVQLMIRADQTNMGLLVTLSAKNVENITCQDIDIGWAILNIHKDVNIWQKHLLLPSAYGDGQNRFKNDIW